MNRDVYIFARDNYTCHCCGKQYGVRKLVKYHKIYRPDLGLSTEIADNIVTLCDECHAKVRDMINGVEIKEESESTYNAISKLARIRKHTMTKGFEQKVNQSKGRPENYKAPSEYYEEKDMQIILDTKILNEEVDKVEKRLKDMEDQLRKTGKASDAEFYRLQGEAIALTRLKDKIMES